MTETERLNALKDDYLEHYGIKGMKWGIIRSREELGYKDTPTKKKKPGVIQSLSQNRKKKKQAKLKAKAKAEAQKMAEAAKKAEEKKAKQAEEDAKTRERLLKAGNKDLDFVYKNRHLLNNRELEETLKRINTEDALKKKISDRPSDFDKAMKTIKKISGTMDDIYSVWDSKSMKAIRKALGGEDASKKDKETDNKKQERKDRRSPSLSEMSRNWRNFSDDELRDSINRLQSEATIRRLLEQRQTADRAEAREQARPRVRAGERRQQASTRDLNNWSRSRSGRDVLEEINNYLDTAERIRRTLDSSNDSNSRSNDSNRNDRSDNDYDRRNRHGN